MDEREAVRQKAAHDLLPAIHHVPVCDCCGLLFALVPHAAHDQEGRLADSLKDAEQGPQCHKRREVLRDSVQRKDGAPQANVQAEILANRDSLNGPIGWVFDDQDCNVNTGRQPGILPPKVSLYWKQWMLLLTCCAWRFKSSRMPIIEANDIVPLSSA